MSKEGDGRERRLGERTLLGTPVKASLSGDLGHASSWWRRRGEKTVWLTVAIVDYSVTGVGIRFVDEAAIGVVADATYDLHVGSATTQIRFVHRYESVGGTIWGATFTDSRPQVLRVIEDSILHKGMAVREAEWNRLRPDT